MNQPVAKWGILQNSFGHGKDRLGECIRYLYPQSTPTHNPHPPLRWRDTIVRFLMCRITCSRTVVNATRCSIISSKCRIFFLLYLLSPIHLRHLCFGSYASVSRPSKRQGQGDFSLSLGCEIGHNSPRAEWI